MSKLDSKIIHKITPETLSKDFDANIKSKYIEGHHWFKNPERWYELVAFTNPYLTIYSELNLIFNNLSTIIDFLNNKRLVFYGIGNGDTETILVKAVLEKNKSVEVVGIDITENFITNFLQALQNLTYENEKFAINFLGIHGLFQQIKSSDLNLLGSGIDNGFIVLGNTIGNFKGLEFFDLLGNIISKDDKLVLGFQTDNSIERIFKRYSENKIFNRFILNSLPLQLREKKLEWKLNEKEKQIEAWIDDILVFHSKKFNPRELIDSLANRGLKNVLSVNDSNACIQIYTYSGK